MEIREGEFLEDLQVDNLRILQSREGFRFGTDSVLLADFVALKPSDLGCDLGTGTGILPLLILSRCPGAHMDALEIQPDMADMAARSVKINNMQDAIHVYECDLRFALSVLKNGAYDVVVCNPPYGRTGATLHCESTAQDIARHEGSCTIDDVICAASRLLKNKGRLYLVYPAQWAYELMKDMEKRHIQPKTLRFVHDTADKSPARVLVMGIKGARPTLNVLPPLILKNPDGSVTAEYKRIYRIGEGTS